MINAARDIYERLLLRVCIVKYQNAYKIHAGGGIFVKWCTETISICASIFLMCLCIILMRVSSRFSFWWRCRGDGLTFLPARRGSERRYGVGAESRRCRPPLLEKLFGCHFDPLGISLFKVPLQTTERSKHWNMKHPPAQKQATAIQAGTSGHSHKPEATSIAQETINIPK